MEEEIEVPPESEERKIPRILIVFFIALFLGGLIAFYLNWNGTQGWLDRGYWQKLQKAADTTYPYEKPEPYLQKLTN